MFVNVGHYCNIYMVWELHLYIHTIYYFSYFSSNIQSLTKINICIILKFINTVFFKGEYISECSSILQYSLLLLEHRLLITIYCNIHYCTVTYISIIKKVYKYILNKYLELFTFLQLPIFENCQNKSLAFQHLVTTGTFRIVSGAELLFESLCL